MKVALRSLAIFVLIVFAPAVLAESQNFSVDEKLAENARKWATEFSTFAKDKYSHDLDFSQVSIKFIDEIVDDLHGVYVKESPSDEEITPLARALGSYVAEVHRIFYGGDWGWLELESGSYPAVQTADGLHFLPLKKALDRIKTGEEPDIWEYYQLMSPR